MKTEDLVQALSADNARQRPSPDRTFGLAVVASVLVAGAMLLFTVGVRPDFLAALGTLRFPFKFAMTIGLALTAGFVFHRALYPVTSRRAGFLLLLGGPLVLMFGVAAELLVLPSETWAMAAQGKNALLCLTVIPALGVVPLGLMLWTLRQGATTRPALAGLCAGLVAGGIAATFYAANCTDDSPLFVATWYPISVVLLGLAGAALGPLVARW